METTTTTTSKSYILKSTTPPPTEYGWACPRCNRINAPWKSTCDCGNWQLTCGNTTAAREDWWKTYVTCTQADVGGSDYWNNTEKIWSNVLKNVSNVKEVY